MYKTPRSLRIAVTVQKLSSILLLIYLFKKKAYIAFQCLKDVTITMFIKKGCCILLGISVVGWITRIQGKEDRISCGNVQILQ